MSGTVDYTAGWDLQLVLA